MKKIKSYLKLIRIHQYLKNGFIFLPLFFALRIKEFNLWIPLGISFVAFSLCASAVYVLNDIMDAKEDHHHPIKKHRPIACGAVSKRKAFIFLSALLITGLGISFGVSWHVTLLLLIYLALNLSYTFYLKHIAILDITVIAIGFVIRLFVGAVTVHISLSNWIILLTFLLALFLGSAKRRDDVLLFNRTGQKMRKSIDGYNLEFVNAILLITSAVTIVSYIMYTISLPNIAFFHNHYLFLTTLFVILGILRYLQITFVEESSGSPTEILVKDFFISGCILGWILCFMVLIYFN